VATAFQPWLVAPRRSFGFGCERPVCCGWGISLRGTMLRLESRSHRREAPLSLLGRLEDLSLPDIIQIVFLSRRTGILEIVDGRGRSTILFRHGLVVDATSPTDLDLMSSLRADGVIDAQNETEIERMLEMGAQLGTALLELAVLPHESLAERVRERIVSIVSPLLTSRDGEFNFILSDSSGQFDLQYDPDTLFREGGIPPQQILGGGEGEKLKPLRGLEESMRAGKALLGTSRQPSEPPPSRPVPDLAAGRPDQRGRDVTEAVDSLGAAEGEPKAPKAPKWEPAPPPIAEPEPDQEPFEDPIDPELVDEPPFSFTPLDEEELPVEEILPEAIEEPEIPEDIPLVGADADVEPLKTSDLFETFFSGSEEMIGVSDLEVSPLEEEEWSPAEEPSAPEPPSFAREVFGRPTPPPPPAEPPPAEIIAKPPAEEIPADAFVPAPRRPAAPIQTETLGERIVLYEPDPLLRVAARRAFTRRGFDFQQFGNLTDAREAIETLLRQGHFFVTFLDLAGTAAGSDSPERLLESVKNVNRSLPVVMIDRDADLRRRHDLLGLGADFYLTKPSAAHLQPGMAEETLGLFADELMLFADRAFEPRRQSIPAEERKEMAEMVEGERSERTYALLKRLISELTVPDDVQQLGETILRMAAEYVERSALFTCSGGMFEGIGGMGESGGGEDLDRRVRRITIPASEPSVLAEVAESGRSHRGKLRRTIANEELVRSLGKVIPSDVVVLPIANHGKVVGVLWGDNGSTRASLQDVSGLEMFLSQAGLALENALIAISRQNASRESNQ